MRVLNRCGAIAAGLLCLSAPVASAAAASAGEGPADGPEVSGTIALGVINASGNSESTSTNLDVETDILYERWRHNVILNAYVASEQGETSAERYGMQLQTEFQVSERAYVFGLGRTEQNRFGPYDRRSSLSFGMGRQFIDRERMTLDLEVGVGHRESEEAATDRVETETTGLLRGDFAWQYSDHGEITEVLEVESGDVNTVTRSITSVKSKLTDDLSWRVSYTIEHNSEVPAGIEQTDTLTTVSLQYGF